MHKERCLERRIGQIVWREDICRQGADDGKVLGMRRGTVVAMRRDQRGRIGLDIQFADTGAVEGGFFDYGVSSLRDLEVLVAGGLLSSSHPDGEFDHGGPPLQEIDLYRRVLAAPTAAYVAAN